MSGANGRQVLEPAPPQWRRAPLHLSAPPADYELHAEIVTSPPAALRGRASGAAGMLLGLVLCLLLAALVVAFAVVASIALLRWLVSWGLS